MNKEAEKENSVLSNTSNTATDVQSFIADLDGGVFEQKLSRVLSEVAAGVIDHEKSGEVNINLKIKRIGNTFQVSVEHKLSFKKPTAKGDQSENNTTITPMHIGNGGKMSLFPDGQTQMFSGRGQLDIES